jgi:hypothetical protein
VRASASREASVRSLLRKAVAEGSEAEEGHEAHFAVETL